MTFEDYLNERQIKYEKNNDNLTVGGSLYLQGTQITSLPDNLTVGGWLDLQGTQIKRKKVPAPSPEKMREFRISLEAKLSWKGGKYRLFDGIFCEVLRKFKNAFKVKIGLKTAYVVTEGENYAHGDTIKEAKESLIYKITERDKSSYEGWSLDTNITLKEAIESYRVITGACEYGTRLFVESLDKKPRVITPSKIIKLTKGQFGNSKYTEFFNKKGNKNEN